MGNRVDNKMRIEARRYTERLGLVRLGDVQRVLELDSGRSSESHPLERMAVLQVPEELIREYEQKLAIIIPIKDEKLQFFEGVIRAVPHDCLLIVVSNSQRRRIDRFQMEQDMLRQFCELTRRQALIIHQKDKVLAKAMADAGYAEMLGPGGRIKSGKSEAMIAAILLSIILGKEYIGFIDADNYFPGAVWEYVKCFVSGLILSTSPYTMTRVLWRYKPKIYGGIYFKKWGRASEITNRYINSFISHRSGFETEVVKTGNAGEHAMSLALAKMLPYASGFAAETQELISILEGLSGLIQPAPAAVAKQGVDVFQLETCNPHLHEDKGEAHLRRGMILPSLSAIYHSALCDDETRQEILAELKRQGIIKEKDLPSKPCLYHPPAEAKLEAFGAVMMPRLGEYLALPTSSSLDSLHI